ncbi:nuclear pore complex protein Nup155-like [Tropilaelaps mercedesae]|uniref:Nuclear pore complex protein Nup155-like n=1 Tax=Tropilaelaps mercedesae TaxID=418985 RepID=A0A1V9XBJ9_9ACAR|nr:nuclear pore complex protein Nup155-like [Tropilaelaps mercedesae]
MDNNNIAPSMAGITTNFQSLNQSFTHSFRHDSIFVYLSRILRPIFDSQLAKEAPPHAGERARLSLELGATALTPVLAQLQGFRGFLSQLVNMPNNNMVMRAQVLSPTDAMQWKLKAVIEEQNSLNNLLVLVTHMIEVLNLWKIVADHDVEAISRNMKPDLFAYLKAITVREFIMCDKQLLSALATAIVDSYLRDGAATAVVSGKLKEFCSSIYGNEDALYTEVFEMLTRACEIRNEREREEMLKEALEKCRQIPVQALNLSMVCRLLDSARYYDGILNICLWAAQNVDPNNLARDFIEHREPPDDDRGRRAFLARKECYALVTEVLDGLYRKVRQQDQPDDGSSNQANQQKYDEMLAKCMDSRDQLLHICVFEWLMLSDQADKLLSLRSAGIEAYLRHRAEQEPTSHTNLELLARHQEVNLKYDQAVRLWLQLAHWQGEMPMDKRLTHLARASICAQSGAPNELQQQAAETLEVARIQADLARELPNEREALNRRLYPINELYIDFAEKYDLAECQLRLLMCGEHDDPHLVSFLWCKLIDQGIARGDVQGALRRAVPLFKNAHSYFPILAIIAQCELRTQHLQYDPLWLGNILCEENGKPWHEIENAYFLIYQKPEFRVIRDHLLFVAAKMIHKMADNMNLISSSIFRPTVRNMLTHIDRYMVDTQGHITDHNMRNINVELVQCRTALERSLEVYGNTANAAENAGAN